MDKKDVETLQSFAQNLAGALKARDALAAMQTVMLLELIRAHPDRSALADTLLPSIQAIARNRNVVDHPLVAPAILGIQSLAAPDPASPSS